MADAYGLVDLLSKSVLVPSDSCAVYLVHIYDIEVAILLLPPSPPSLLPSPPLPLPSLLLRLSSEGHEVTEITLDQTLIPHPLTISRLLQFLYTGIVELTKDSELLDDTIAMATLFNLPELQLICENAKKDDEFLNPSIGTWLNDRNSSVAKQLFLDKALLSDVRFRVEGRMVSAHRLVLCTRCEVMAAMLTGGFRESESATEVCVSVHVCMLQFLSHVQLL